MSLCIAIWESPERYVLAADSRVTRDIDRPADDGVTKASRIGSWLVAWVGGMPAGVRLVRELHGTLTTLPLDAADPARVESALREAWEATVTACGPTPAGDYPRTGASLLCVGPSGIVEMESSGCLIWETPDSLRRGYRAVGCAKDYAIGWLDREARGSLELIEFAGDVVKAAARRFPGVGGPVTMLRGPA